MCTTLRERIARAAEDLECLMDKKAKVECTLESCLEEIKNVKMAICMAEREVAKGIKKHLTRARRANLKFEAQALVCDLERMESVVSFYDMQFQSACKRYRKCSKQ